MQDSARLTAFIQGAARLPVLPKITVRLLNVVDAADSSVGAIADIIRSEPTLTARMLKLANSSFYGRRGQVSSVQNAVAVLGAKTIRSMALAIWAHTLKSHARSNGEMLLMAPVLAHGLACGVIARMLMERVDRNLGEEAFLAGLLHDIGRVALVGQMGDEYRLWILEAAQANQVSLHEMEERVLGFDHRGLGVALTQSWMFPTFLVDIIGRHHDADIVPEAHPVLSAVAIADDYATRLGHNLNLGTLRSSSEKSALFFGLKTQAETTEFMELCQHNIAAANAALA